MSAAYEATANSLVERIDALVPAHPEILGFDSPWQLFKVEGFRCDDLGPSLGQASAALAVVQARHRKSIPSGTPPQES